MNTISSHYLDELGIIRWESRYAPQTAPVCDESAWENLKETVKHCRQCSLHQGRTNTVFGVGSQQASLMIIGEAPGFHEDQQGEPFVGRAGQLLTAMLKSIGLRREDVFIANILKCRPPDNRDPQADEIQTCTAFLTQQIALIQPDLLLAVGRIAAQYLLNCSSPLKSLRNTIHHYGESQTPLIVTYHPAYLLRSPADKKMAFSDLQFVRKKLSTAVR